MKRAVHRAPTERERQVLDLLLSVDFDGAGDLRRQSEAVVVTEGCGCGCPSINFVHPDVSTGIRAVVDAGVRGTNDSLFLFTAGPYLGGIEYVPNDQPMVSELPEPGRIELWPPSGR